MGNVCNQMRNLIVFILLLAGTIKGDREVFVARAGAKVLLPCPVSTAECGEFHSLKWYRDTSRMYVYSPVADFSNAEGSLVDRCLDISQRSLGPKCSRGYLEVTDTNADLKISPVEILDAGEYRCEITYLDVSNNCPFVHFTKLQTVAAPEYVRMFMTNDPDEDISGQIVGPYPSGSSVEFSCQAGGGKPAPTVAWKFKEEDLEGETTVDEDSVTGEITVTSVVVVELEREQSGARLTCLVVNEAIDEPLSTQVQIDVNVAVKSVFIQDAIGKENEEMSLICTASGGRPLATLTWSMPEDVEYETEEESNIMEDETFELISTLRFTPTAGENEKTVVCKAINDVMEEALEDETQLNILYVPLVTIEDENKTLTAGEEITINCLIDANPMNFSQVQWFHNDDIIDVEDESFESWNSEEVSLVINSIIPGDAGKYKCLAENEVGQAHSANSFDLEVLYPPRVQLRIEPEGPVSEEEQVNVTLYCDVVDGNPLELNRVSWFLNGDLIRQLTDHACDDLMEIGSEEMLSDNIFVIEENADYVYPAEYESSGAKDANSYLCDVDPTELMLQAVRRDLQGNFSCAGGNAAGEGGSSDVEELIVHYLPGQAEMVQNEKFPLKGASTVLTCTVQDLGNPEATEFIWQKGDNTLEETKDKLILDDLGVSSEDNISCSAINEIGFGESSNIQFEVFVPPTLIRNLPEETSFLSSGEDLSLMCQVECVPLCTIKWFKNNEPINSDDGRYDIEESIIAEDPDLNQFKSVSSKLFWNLENFPDNKLDHNELNFTISCQVDGNDIGQAISSTSQVTIEYAPENVETSLHTIEIEEGDYLEPVLCTADASPEAAFVWKYEDAGICEGGVIVLAEPITKEQSGDYFCHISNDHGEEIRKVTIDVLYKPECAVTYSMLEEEVVLLCSANGNPNELTFWWERQNKTFEGQTSGGGLESELRLKLLNESLGDYFCHVNNSIGEGEACRIEITEMILAKGLSGEELIIIVAVAAGVLAIILVISILVCVYCGKGNGDAGSQTLKMRNLKLFEIIQVLQIIIFFASGGNSHSQFQYKAILPK